MICYKGNSFFRNIKILIKDFDEKVKKDTVFTTDYYSIFYR